MQKAGDNLNVTKVPINRSYTVFQYASDILEQQQGAVVSSVISNWEDSVVADWMKAMTQTLPVATYLNTINMTKYAPSVPNAVSLSVRRKAFCTALGPILNFTMLGQQSTIKYITSLSKHLSDYWSLFQ